MSAQQQQQEATINPDGSTTFESPPGSDQQQQQYQDTNTDGGGNEDFANGGFNDTADATAPIKSGGIDPAIYVLLGLALIATLYYFLVYRKQKANSYQDDFFSNLDGEKFNLKLPPEVDEYYEIRAKCEDAGWEPGSPPPQNVSAQSAGPHRTLAQALMKRAIADIPIVQHIQKESAGMNKLYAQSMCSVKQWRAYQAAENLVSSEVDDVRAEADDIEPGWSQIIWRQAMQYHQMLKQKQEQEAKAAEEQAKKRKEIEARVAAARGKTKEELEKEREMAAEKAAAELIKQEEKEKETKKSFSGAGGMKKGFLDSKPKKK